MAFTLEELEAKRDALITALSRGELSVTFADRTTMYKSTEAIIDAIDWFEGRISRLVGRSRQSLAVASKGLA